MALSYKVLGQVEPAATTLTTLYTVPTGAGNYAVISSINLVNTVSTPANVRVAVRPAGAAAEDKHYIIYDSIINGNQTQTFTIGITVASTDVISVYSTSGSIVFNLFGSENS